MTALSVESLRPDEFEARFGNLFRALYCGAVACRASFVRQDWQFVLLAVELYSLRWDFEPIAAAARHCGDEGFVATDVETEPPHQHTLLLPWDWATVARALHPSWLTSFNSAIFGRSGAWAGLCSKSDYSILAGEPRFMDPFIAASGGLAQMKARFTEEFSGGWHDGAGSARPDEDVIRDLFADIGWI